MYAAALAEDPTAFDYDGVYEEMQVRAAVVHMQRTLQQQHYGSHACSNIMAAMPVLLEHACTAPCLSSCRTEERHRPAQPGIGS